MPTDAQRRNLASAHNAQVMGLMKQIAELERQRADLSHERRKTYNKIASVKDALTLHRCLGAGSLDGWITAATNAEVDLEELIKELAQ